MRLHAKVTLSELPLEWDDLSFQLRPFPSYPTFLRYLKECLTDWAHLRYFIVFPTSAYQTTDRRKSAPTAESGPFKTLRHPGL